jgi:hypothetical protein
MPRRVAGTTVRVRDPRLPRLLPHHAEAALRRPRVGSEQGGAWCPAGPALAVRGAVCSAI